MWWLIAWWQQAMPWINVDLSSVRSGDIDNHLRAIRNRPHPSITKVSLETISIQFISFKYPGSHTEMNYLHSNPPQCLFPTSPVEQRSAAKRTEVLSMWPHTGSHANDGTRRCHIATTRQTPWYFLTPLWSSHQIIAEILMGTPQCGATQWCHLFVGTTVAYQCVNVSGDTLCYH